VVKRVPEGQVDGLVNVVVKRQNLGSVEFEITAATASGGNVDQFSANALNKIKVKKKRISIKQKDWLTFSVEVTVTVETLVTKEVASLPKSFLKKASTDPTKRIPAQQTIKVNGICMVELVERTAQRLGFFCALPVVSSLLLYVCHHVQNLGNNN
jgi:hypothetical protein